MSAELAELVTIQLDHWVDENLNLGQYKTEFRCVCGSKWVHDGHNPYEASGTEMFAKHVAEAIINAGYRKEAAK